MIVLYQTIICLFLFHSPKSLPVKFQQMNSRGTHRQSGGWANKQQRASQMRSHQGNQNIINNFNHFKSYSSKIPHRQSQSINAPTKPLSNPLSRQIAKASPSIHPSIHHPTPYHTHPEERIWAGRTPRRKPRVPDAPKIKHDKMKQFYMIDMERKRW